MSEPCTIGRISGEFRDEATERRYRGEHLEASSSTLHVVALSTAGIFAGFTLVDLQSLGFGPAWAVLLVLRLGVAGLILFVGRRIRVAASSFVSGSGLMLLTTTQVALYAVTLLACALRPQDATTNALSTTVVMLAALVGVPGRHRTQALLAVALLVGLVAVSKTRFTDPVLPLGPLVANLTGALLWGLAILEMSNRRQRQQWSATLRERAARQRLDDELRVADRLRAELQELARQDPLTHAANRRELLRVATAELERERRSEGLSLVMLDLDRFKSVNDRFGHAAGDAALVEVVTRVGAVLRHDDLLARLGGEEFAVLLPGSDEVLAARTAERIRATVARNLRAGDSEEPLTVSVGVASALPGDTVDALLARADAAMYAAKRSGGDAVLVADGSADLARALVEVDHE